MPTRVTQASRGAIPDPPSTAERRDDRVRLLNDQVALSRVAGLVAEGAALADVLSVVVAEVSGVLGVPAVRLEQYEGGAELVVLAVTGWDRLAPGSRRPLESGSLAATVLQTGQPYDLAREAAVPIIVHGSVWGLMSVRAERNGALPDTTDTRLGKLAEFVAVAIANAQARDELRSLADEHAALRRVATLVAEQAPATELFAAVGHEVAQVLRPTSVPLCMARPGPPLPVGTAANPALPGYLNGTASALKR